MTVSAVIPVRDGERYLGEAIASLHAQTVPPDEIVVVDDGSSDGSAALAAAAGARVIAIDAAGPAVARNEGARAAGGDLLAFLDADDIATPDRLALSLAALDGADTVYGGVRHFLSPDRPELAGRLHVPDGVQHAPHAGTLLMARERFLATGGFRTEFEPGEFVEWVDRMRAGGLRERRIDAVLLERRVHGGNLTLRADRLAYARAARAAVLRRRAG